MEPPRHSQADLDDARSLLDAMMEKDKRLLGHFCTLVVVERALAKLVTCSPIQSIDPITGHAADFVRQERPDLSFSDALKIVGWMGLVLVRDDIARQFLRYDRNSVL